VTVSPSSVQQTHLDGITDKQRHLLQHETLTVRKFTVDTAVLEALEHMLKKNYLTSNYYQQISIRQLSLKMSDRQCNAKKILACQHKDSITPKSDFSIAFCPGFSLFSFKIQSLWWVYSTSTDCYSLFQMQMPSSRKRYYRNPMPSFMVIYQMISEPCRQISTDIRKPSCCLF
jgi:hypothetical protein